MLSIGIVGPGRLGGALAIALARKGYRIGTLFVRDGAKGSRLSRLIEPTPAVLALSDPGALKEDLILITTGDDSIENVAAELAGKRASDGRLFLHTSGSLSSAVLEPLKISGAKVGSMHPLVSVSNSETGSLAFEGAYFCVEGDADAIESASKLVHALGGTPFSINTERKALYHASAVMACGHLVALVDIAVEALVNSGLSDAAAKEVLMPLITSTVRNLQDSSPAMAITGTFARADVETFDRHVESMKSAGLNGILDLYLVLGERSLVLAEIQGAEIEKIEIIRKRIWELKSRSAAS